VHPKILRLHKIVHVCRLVGPNSKEHPGGCSTCPTQIEGPRAAELQLRRHLPASTRHGHGRRPTAVSFRSLSLSPHGPTRHHRRSPVADAPLPPPADAPVPTSFRFSRESHAPRAREQAQALANHPRVGPVLYPRAHQRVGGTLMSSTAARWAPGSGLMSILWPTRGPRRGVFHVAGRSLARALGGGSSATAQRHPRRGDRATPISHQRMPTAATARGHGPGAPATRGLLARPSTHTCERRAHMRQVVPRGVL
jgi:hypothetical protein